MSGFIRNISPYSHIMHEGKHHFLFNIFKKLNPGVALRLESVALINIRMNCF